MGAQRDSMTYVTCFFASGCNIFQIVLTSGSWPFHMRSVPSLHGQCLTRSIVLSACRSPLMFHCSITSLVGSSPDHIGFVSSLDWEIRTSRNSSGSSMPSTWKKYPSSLEWVWYELVTIKDARLYSIIRIRRNRTWIRFCTNSIRIVRVSGYVPLHSIKININSVDD